MILDLASLPCEGYYVRKNGVWKVTLLQQTCSLKASYKTRIEFLVEEEIWAHNNNIIAIGEKGSSAPKQFTTNPLDAAAKLEKILDKRQQEIKKEIKKKTKKLKKVQTLDAKKLVMGTNYPCMCSMQQITSTGCQCGGI